MKRLIIFLLLILITSCNSTKKTYETKNYNFKDEHLNVTRNVEKIKDGVKITLIIESKINLKGYFTITEKLNRPIHLVIDSKCPYKPYFESDNEIRFVFSDPNKTDRPDISIPIPESPKFKVSYIIMDKTEKERLILNGRILYLVNNRPVPEFNMITEIY